MIRTRTILLHLAVLCGTAAAAGAAELPTLLDTVTGQTYGDQLGRVASAGDVNGDGYSDFIVGAPGFDYGSTHVAGYAVVVSGATGEPLFRVDAGALGDNFGTDVGPVGDWNGDGRDDFFVGASGASPGGRTRAGSVYIYSGKDGTLLTRLDGPEDGDALGASAAGLGDVDGDGHPDIAAGATGASPVGRTNAGAVIVFSGATGLVLYRVEGAAANDVLGYSVRAVGDVDGDGKTDFVAGAPGVTPNPTGTVLVCSGGSGAVLYTKSSPTPSDLLGVSVAGAGDLDGDGRPDFMAGAPRANGGNLFQSGRVYVWSGATGELLYAFDGPVASGWMGESVADAGDVDGDGRDDVILGAPFTPGVSGGWRGAAYVFSGRTRMILMRIGPLTDGTELGSSVSSAGDVNGDGRADVIAGDPVYDHVTDPTSGFYLTRGRALVYGIPGPVRTVSVDVKPGTCPNPLNVSSRGTLSVAVLGEADFDVTRIDPATVRLSGSPAVRSAPDIEDVGGPAPGAPGQCACPATGRDGQADRLFQFSTEDLAWRLGPVADGDVRTLRLSGALDDGSRFEGTDCVVVQANRKTLAAGALRVIGGNPVRGGGSAALALRVPAGGADVDVEVFSVTGRLVARLASGRRPEGLQTIHWDGRSTGGGRTGAGLYFVRARVGGGVSTARVVVLP